MKQIHWFLSILLLLFGLSQAACGSKDSHQSRQQPVSEQNKPSPGKGNNKTTDVPAYVLEVLAHVEQNGKALPNYVGGRTFENRERRLAEKDKQGNEIRYREWDVHPKVPGQNRGAERLITGNDKSAYYTNNHYKTFKRIQ